MFVAELIVKCPKCGSETHLISEEANPVIFHCHGCSRGVVLHNNTIFTVSDEYLKGILLRHKPKKCGRILTARLSADAQNFINTEKIQELRSLLTRDMDVEEFIKKIQ
jgi:hypothetical protein